MCQKQYFENLVSTKVRANLLQSNVFVPTALADIFTITRDVVTSGGVNPTASNAVPIPGTPNANLTGSTAGVITYPAQGLVTFTNAPFNPLQNLFPGNFINGQRFGMVNQTPGSNLPPLPQNGVAGVVRYWNGAINQNLPVTVVCIASIYGATFDLMFSAAPPLPLDFVRLVDVTFGYNFPPATNVYNYSITPTVAPTSIPLPVLVRTNRSNTAFTNIDEDWNYTNIGFGAQQILSLTDADDPIVNGWANPVSFVAAYDPALPTLPGWTFKADKPFLITALGKLGTVTGAGAQYAGLYYELETKVNQHAYQNLLFNMSVGIADSLNVDPHLGYSPATLGKITYIAGDYNGQFYPYMGATPNYDSNIMAITFPGSQAKHFWDLELTRLASDTQSHYNEFILSLQGNTEPRFWLAPGTYFMPQMIVPASLPGYDEFAAYITAEGTSPDFATIELVSIA